jgi:hypothetical protein
MEKRILVIGATCLLGEPVASRLKSSGFEFDARDLVKALAACRAESDQMPITGID